MITTNECRNSAMNTNVDTLIKRLKELSKSAETQEIRFFKDAEEPATKSYQIGVAKDLDSMEKFIYLLIE